MTRRMCPYVPGDRVVLEDMPQWGVGQVQSVTEDRLTVNFEDGGKQTLRFAHVALRKASAADRA